NAPSKRTEPIALVAKQGALAPSQGDQDQDCPCEDSQHAGVVRNRRDGHEPCHGPGNRVQQRQPSPARKVRGVRLRSPAINDPHHSLLLLTSALSSDGAGWAFSLGAQKDLRAPLPRIRRSPCETESAAESGDARAPWNKWRGPGHRGGGRLCRERPLQATLAALRFARAGD